MKAAASVVLLAASVSSAQAATDIVRCTAKGYQDITLTFGEKRLGKTVGCIAGSFIYDMEPCAPKGWYGLSYPTGPANLARFVRRWQEYGDHLGGVASYDETPTTILFSGGWNGGEGSGYAQRYSFVVDRLTGVGKLEAEDPSTEKKYKATYACVRARAKL